jgi:hypothetical protein
MIAQKRKDHPAKGGLFFQGRIVLTEENHRQNFLARYYEPAEGVSTILSEINGFIINHLTKKLTGGLIPRRPLNNYDFHV